LVLRILDKNDIGILAFSLSLSRFAALKEKGKVELSIVLFQLNTHFLQVARTNAFKRVSLRGTK